MREPREAELERLLEELVMKAVAHPEDHKASDEIYYLMKERARTNMLQRGQEIGQIIRSGSKKKLRKFDLINQFLQVS